MSKNNSTQGKSSVGQCTMPVVITNKFKKMMLRAHKAQEKILVLRENSLKDWVGTDKIREKNEFRKIFGVDGGHKFDPESEVTALMIMLDGIKRMKSIHNQMFRADKNDKLTCYYLNNTVCGNFVARAPASIDKDYYIFIAGKFEKANLTGANSQVSTLCHEMSHFVPTGEKGISGGMGTDDMNKYGKRAFLSAGEHINAANYLRSHPSEVIFRSAYNIEKYFEITLSPDVLAEIDSAVEEEMKKEIIIIVDNSPPESPGE